jgi:complement component 1 Q subcomponent-binding protein
MWVQGGSRLVQPMLVAPSSRSFSALTDLLQREHAEEVESNTTEMPADLADLKSLLEQEDDWKIVDDGAMTKLYRTLGTAAKVQVAFHCQDTVEEGAGLLDEEVFEGDDEEEPSDPIRFNVTITKAGKTLAMTCITTDDLAASIQSLAVTGQLQDDYLIAASEYQGPEFAELAQDLQEEFHNYLEDEVGVSENLISFLSMYCDYKEQTMYVKFLSDAKSLVG